MSRELLQQALDSLEGTDLALHYAAVTADRDAEIAALRAEVAQLRQYLDAAQRRAAALGDEAAKLREDAERYRWLRDWGQSSDWEFIAWQTDTDAAIDAALAARKGEATTPPPLPSQRS